METPIGRLTDQQHRALAFALDALGLRSAFAEVARLGAFALGLAALQAAKDTRPAGNGAAAVLPDAPAPAPGGAPDAGERDDC